MEALYVVSEVTIIQGKADFHPEWFQSTVKTISFKEWKQLNLSKRYNSFTDISAYTSKLRPWYSKYCLTKTYSQV